MKKLYLLITVLALVAVSGVFANGQSEPRDLTDTWDTVTITGQVSFKTLPYPEITSRGKTYELMVPRFATDDLNIKSGDEITVEGIVVDRLNSTGNYLMVGKATIGGREYEVPLRGAAGGAYGGMMGPGYGGMMGPGYGGMMGPGYGGMMGPGYGDGYCCDDDSPANRPNDRYMPRGRTR